MKKEDIQLVSQLIFAMREISEKMKGALIEKNSKDLMEAKREILSIQKRINEII